MIEKKKPVTTPASSSQRTNATSHTSQSTKTAHAPHGSPTTTPTARNSGLFTKSNYAFMLAGLVVIAIGMLLMIGGNSNDPNVFDQKQVYSTTRITIAPLLIIIGLALEVFAIFKNPRSG